MSVSSCNSQYLVIILGYLQYIDLLD